MLFGDLVLVAKLDKTNNKITHTSKGTSFLYLLIYDDYYNFVPGPKGDPGPARPSFVCVRIKANGSVANCPLGYSATSCVGLNGCRHGKPDVTVKSCHSVCPKISYYPEPMATLAICCK